jgi:5-methylcytosine-specific restriction endonuclease McrA
MASVSELVRQQVFAEADHYCEYCRTSRRLIGMPLVIDHIIPQSADGGHERGNLAAACYRCNEFKGARTHALDHVTGELLPLFHPRQQAWHDHFAWANGGTHIVGLTAIGRATVVALRLNNEYVVEARALWVSRGWHPPT